MASGGGLGGAGGGTWVRPAGRGKLAVKILVQLLLRGLVRRRSSCWASSPIHLQLPVPVFALEPGQLLLVIQREQAEPARLVIAPCLLPILPESFGCAASITASSLTRLILAEGRPLEELVANLVVGKQPPAARASTRRFELFRRRHLHLTDGAGKGDVQLEGITDLIARPQDLSRNGCNSRRRGGAGAGGTGGAFVAWPKRKRRRPARWSACRGLGRKRAEHAGALRRARETPRPLVRARNLTMKSGVDVGAERYRRQR